MDQIHLWITKFVGDFLALTPTAQITFIFGAAACISPIVYGLVRWRTAKKVDVVAAPAEDPRLDRILKLVENGSATAAEAGELARTIYVAESGGSRETLAGNQPTALSTSDAGEREDRSSFANVVTELAMSSEAVDRKIVLNYARGKVDVAIHSLEQRARKSGKKGAPIWREVAALAYPHDISQAEAALRRAIELDPQDVPSMCRLSRTLLEADRPKEAEDLAAKALKASSTDEHRARASIRLSKAVRADGRLEKAFEIAGRAIDHAREAAIANPMDVDSARFLAAAFAVSASTRAEMGQFVEAAEDTDKALKLYDHLAEKAPDDEEIVQDAVDTFFLRSGLESEMGDIAASVRTLGEAKRKADSALTGNAGNIWLKAAVAEATLRLAFKEDELGRDDSALDHARSAETLAQELVNRNSRNANALRSLIWSLTLQARLHLAGNRIDEARKSAERMVDLARDHARNGTDAARFMLSVALDQKGSIERGLDDLLEAEECFGEAAEIAHSLSAANPDSISRKREKIHAMGRLSDLANDREECLRHRTMVQEELAVSEEVVEKHPASWTAKQTLAYSLLKAGDASRRCFDEDEALALTRRGLMLYEQVAAENPSSFDALHGLYDSRRVYAAQLNMAGKTEEAREITEQALEDLRSLEAKTSNHARLRPAIFSALSSLSDIHSTTGSSERALDFSGEACALLEDDLKAAPEKRGTRHGLVDALLTHSDLLLSRNRLDDALDRIEQAEKIVETGHNRPDRDGQRRHTQLISKKADTLREIGRIIEADTLQRQYVEAVENYAKDNPDPGAQAVLFGAYESEFTHAIAASDLSRTEELLDRMGTILPSFDRNVRLRRSFGQSIDWRRFLVACERHDMDAQKRLNRSLITSYREEIAANPVALQQRITLCYLMVRDISLHWTLGDPPSVFDTIEAEIDVLDRDFPAQPNWLSGGAEICRFIASQLDRSGHYRQSIAFYERALAFHDRRSTDGETITTRASKLDVHLSLCEAYAALHELNAADIGIASAREHFQALEDAHDDEKKLRTVNLLIGTTELNILWSKGKRETIGERLDTLLPLALKIVEESKDDWSAWQSLGTTQGVKYALLFLRRDFENAAMVLPDLIESYRRFGDLRGDAELIDRLRLISDEYRASLALETGDIATACEHFGDGIERRRQAFEKFRTLGFHEGLVSTYCLGGRIALGSGDDERGLQLLHDSIATADEISAYAPQVIDMDVQRLESRYRIATTTGDPADIDRVNQQWSDLEAQGRNIGLGLWIDDMKADARFSPVSMATGK